MIESEEKSYRLEDLIANWCKHTKIEVMLRQQDIPNLVSQILDEFYPVKLSCGHQVKETSESVILEFEDYITDRSDFEHGGGIGRIQGVYCADCAAVYKKKLKAREL